MENKLWGNLETHLDQPPVQSTVHSSFSKFSQVIYLYNLYLKSSSDRDSMTFLA